MSELTAWLADLSLEHVEETLIDAGITRVDEIGAMDAESLATIGIEADAISTLFTALGRVSQVATPLPAPPQLPAAVAAAAAQQQQQQPAADAPTPPPLVWQRSVEGVWEEHAGQHDDAAAAGHSEWEAIDTPDGHVYYYHAATGESTWEKPAALGGGAAATDVSDPLPTPPPLPILPAPHDDDLPELSVSEPAPPPVPPPLAPPPLVWRRSMGEYLAEAENAAAAGLPAPPRPMLDGDEPSVQQAGGYAAEASTSTRHARQPTPEEQSIQRLSVSITRNDYGLGLSFNDDNEIVHIDPRGGAAVANELAVGDVVLAIDGLALHGKPIRDGECGGAANDSDIDTTRLQDRLR